MHCTYCDMPTGTSHAIAMLNSEKLGS